MVKFVLYVFLPQSLKGWGACEMGFKIGLCPRVRSQGAEAEVGAWRSFPGCLGG